MTPARDGLVDEVRTYVSDERVLTAIRDVPRHRFVPAELADRAWENVALPIGRGQTISQPSLVARMCELLEIRPGDRVLDVGTGSGYHAAVLARLGADVWSVELHPELSRQARANLDAAGATGVRLFVGDGKLGLAEAAPFDAINVAAAAAAVPPMLEEQLGPGGRLVAPVQTADQRLWVVRRTDGALHRTAFERVNFVPML